MEYVSVGRALRLFEHFDVISGHFHGQVLVHPHPDFRYITLLRHPVDRIVSGYYFLRSSQFETTDYPHVVAARSMSLIEYVSQKTGAAVDALESNMTLHYAAARGAFISSGDLLSAALANIMRYDVVGVVEDLPGFFERLCRRFGWPSPGDAFLENRTTERPSLDAIDPEVRAIIETRNSLDIALYDAVVKIAARTGGFALAHPGDIGERDAQHMASCSVHLVAFNDLPTTRIAIVSGDRASIRAKIAIPQALSGGLIGVIIVRDAAGELVYTANAPLPFVPQSGNDMTTLPLQIDLTMRLGIGHYTLDLCIQHGHHADSAVGAIHRKWLAVDIVGHKHGWFAGTADLEARWTADG